MSRFLVVAICILAILSKCQGRPEEVKAAAETKEASTATDTKASGETKTATETKAKEETKTETKESATKVEADSAKGEATASKSASASTDEASKSSDKKESEHKSFSEIAQEKKNSFKTAIEHVVSVPAKIVKGGITGTIEGTKTFFDTLIKQFH